MGLPQGWRSAAARSNFSDAFGSVFEQMEGAAPQPGQAEKALDRVAEDYQRQVRESEDEAERERQKEWDKGGIVLLAYDNSRQLPGEPRTAIALSKKTVGNISLQEAADQATEGVLGEIKTQTIELPIGPAVEMVSKYQTIAGDDIFEYRYILLDAGDRYMVKFICANNESKFPPIARPLMETLRIRPADSK